MAQRQYRRISQNYLMISDSESQRRILEGLSLNNYQKFLILQQQDLSKIVFLKISSISYYFLCSLNGLFPFMKLSISTTLHCPNRYFPSHSTRVYNLYLDSRWGGAYISFSKTTRCSQVFSSSGTGSSGTVRRRGDLTRTRMRSSIFSYPLQMVLLVSGLANRSLSLVRQSGVQVISPNYLSQAQRWYQEGCWFSLLTMESPRTIRASTILQLSLISSENFFYSVILSWYFFPFAPQRDYNTRSLNPSSQYSSIYLVLQSTIEQRLALYTLSKKSVIVVGWILQQLITRSGRYPQDQ